MICPECGHAAIDHGESRCGQETSHGDCTCALSAFQIAKLYVDVWKSEAEAAREYIHGMEHWSEHQSLQNMEDLQKAYRAARVPAP